MKMRVFPSVEWVVSTRQIQATGADVHVRIARDIGWKKCAKLVEAGAATRSRNSVPGNYDVRFRIALSTLGAKGGSP